MSRPSETGPRSGSSCYNAGRVSADSNSGSRQRIQVYPFSTHTPTYANTASRRHSMTVQHILNPSDEDPRRSASSHSVRSSDNESDKRVSGSSSTVKPPGSDRHAHRDKPTQWSVRKRARINRQIRPQRSPSTSESEAGEIQRRDPRKKYLDEQARFIW